MCNLIKPDFIIKHNRSLLVQLRRVLSRDHWKRASECRVENVCFDKMSSAIKRFTTVYVEIIRGQIVSDLWKEFVQSVFRK